MQFKDRGSEDVFNGVRSAAARRKLPTELVSRAVTQLDRINFSATLDDLRIPPSNRLEALKGDRRGQHSIRINSKYRICFRWESGEAVDVEIIDYH